MGSIINGFNKNLPSQSRIRVKIEDVNACEVFFDFALDSYLYSFYYTLDGSVPTPSSLITFPKASKSIAFNTQVRLLIVKESDQSEQYAETWTPPPEFWGFNFAPIPTERPSCTNGDCDLRYFDGLIYAHTAPINSKMAAVIVYAKDTGTICEDVGIFYSLDGSDPDPCASEGTGLGNFCDPNGADQCREFNTTSDLINTLAIYETIAVRIGTPIWLVAKAVDSQADSGGCVEFNCGDSIDGGSWLL